MFHIYRNILFTTVFLCISTFSFAATNKTDVTVGVTPREKSVSDEEPVFGGGYLLFDSTMGNDYVTMAGKLYWRFSSAAKGDDESQK